jgi:hypothetical protein
MTCGGMMEWGSYIMAAVKRILREVRQIQEDPSTEFVGGPLEDNLFVSTALCAHAL